MNKSDSTPPGNLIVEEIPLNLLELCHACCASEEYVIAWIIEGVLEPSGETQQDWHFTGQSLSRAKLAMALTRDLEVNAPGIALVLDLLEEISDLKRQLQCFHPR